MSITNIKIIYIKLIIQIPCYNEEQTLPLVLQELPAQITGIDVIEVQIVDDGSTDKTIAVAQKMGVDQIVRHIGNKGLGNAFRTGVNHALAQGVDILVNTDGDNQYPSRYIPALIQPILEQQADIVVGNRQTSQIKHFSPIKRFFQWLGTKVTIILSGEKEVEDAVSGFRAYSREALLELNVTSSFSYVLDTTVQASNKKLKMVSVPITTNLPTRPSRLFKNMWEHIRKSGIQVLRVYALYRPLRVFLGLGAILFLTGAIPIIRFLYDYFFVGGGDGMIQSLVIGSVLLSVSFNCFALGIIGDLLGRNRTLIEFTLKEIKKTNLDKTNITSTPKDAIDFHE
ncbi:MAG: glycosyltransferase family 2 protein [Saprospiraceae bacterium]